MSSSPQSDFELLEAWRAGEDRAGRELFERHFESVFRFFRNKLDHGAEDLTQQTFLGLVKAKHSFRGDSSFRTFIFTVARKRLYTHLRDRGRRKDAEVLSTRSVVDLGLASPSRVVAAKEEQRLLLRGLRRLPIDMQVALELFYWEDMGINEISAVLEIPAGTVKSRLQRARARLDGILEELAGSEALLKSTVDNFDAWARELQGQLGSSSSPDGSQT